MAAELLVAAAKDARAAPVHAVKNMAASAIHTLMQYSPKTINDNSWYINGNSCKKNN